MDPFAYIFSEFLQVTGVVAIITGAMLGFYLAAINRFIPVRSLSKSLMTNIVTATSFFIPLFLLISTLPGGSERGDRWIAAFILYLMFSTTADVSNWLWCHRGPFRK